MSAIITDGILQAGINYNTVVRPKVEQLLSQYPNDKTTSAFYGILTNNSLEKIIGFSGRKVTTILETIRLWGKY
jgi:hypothetical protein